MLESSVFHLHWHLVTEAIGQMIRDPISTRMSLPQQSNGLYFTVQLIPHCMVGLVIILGSEYPLTLWTDGWMGGRRSTERVEVGQEENFISVDEEDCYEGNGDRDEADDAIVQT